MLGAEHVCRAWRRVALEEPALWRRIGWRTIDEIIQRHIGEATEMALGRSGPAPSLKTLDINEFRGYDEFTEELIAAFEKLPMLEDLQIYFKCEIEDVNMFPSVCQACPNLKKLVLMFAGPCELEYNEDEFSKEPINGEIRVMHELRTLELYECDLTGRGLNSILDSCQLLESLCIAGYFNKHDIDEELRVKCARVKKLTLPTRSKPSYECYCEYVGYSDSEEDYEE
ncbi:hypothetical protein EJB05_52446, partial [Eragrostis curvula]